MIFVEVGTTNAVEAYVDASSDDPDKVRYREAPGERIIELTVPDDVPLAEAFRTVVGAIDISITRGSRPDWVTSSSDGLVTLMVEHYSMTSNQRPEKWGEETGAHLLARPGSFSLMLAVSIAFLFTRLFGLELRTTAGRDFQARVMGDTSSNGSGAYSPGKYIGVTANNTIPDAADTLLAGEVVAGTLIRAQATYSHVSGTATYALTKTFTSDQTIVLAKLGVFNGSGPGGAASSSNALVFETLLSDTAPLVSGDQTQVTQTVTL